MGFWAWAIIAMVLVLWIAGSLPIPLFIILVVIGGFLGSFIESIVKGKISKNKEEKTKTIENKRNRSVEKRHGPPSIEDKKFFESLLPEIGPSICKHENCNHKTVAYSVMCAKHHFEMVMNMPCPWTISEDVLLDSSSEDIDSDLSKEAALALQEIGGSKFRAATIKADGLKDVKQDSHSTYENWGLKFAVPADVSLYTATNPGPMASRITSETPLWLVSSALELERINVKVSQFQDATEKELEELKQKIENEGLPLPKYQRTSIKFKWIGKQGDKRAIEHIHELKQREPKKLRQIIFIHRGRLFNFTCATSPKRFDTANRQFFDLIFSSMEFK